MMKKNSITIYLALRRLLPKSDSAGIVLLPRLAFASITIGVAASILILSLANGLHDHYLRRIAESDSHVSVMAMGRGIPAYQALMSGIRSIPGVEKVYPYSQNEALIKHFGDTAGIFGQQPPPLCKRLQEKSRERKRSQREDRKLTLKVYLVPFFRHAAG